MHGRADVAPPALDPHCWQQSEAYLYGLDLFNHGYYWEAHEAWEGLWHAAGRRGAVADFLKGLIKLAAAGVKVRQGIPAGVVSHAQGAAASFRQAQEATAAEHLGGLSLSELCARAAAIEARSARPDDGADGTRIVFDFVLVPRPAE